METMKMADILRELRSDKGITQKELAESTGLSISAVKSYENGLREPNSKAMAALERFFKVSGDFLRGNIDKSTFYQNSADIQSELDKLITLFGQFQHDFNATSQQNQKTAIEVLEQNIILISKHLLLSDTISDVSPSDVSAVLSSFLSLNQQGRTEILKRADELTQLKGYLP